MTIFPPLARFIAGLPVTELEKALCKNEAARGLPEDWEHVIRALDELEDSRLVERRMHPHRQLEYTYSWERDAFRRRIQS